MVKGDIPNDVTCWVWSGASYPGNGRFFGCRVSEPGVEGPGM